MKFKRQSDRDTSIIDVAPLIDVVFLLLIFFMVSATFNHQSHLKIDLPKAHGNPGEVKHKHVEVVIDAKGHIAVNDKPLINNRRDTLKRAVEKVAGGDNKIPYVITADAMTPHEYVVRAMDVAGQLGFVQLSITTKRESDSSQ